MNRISQLPQFRSAPFRSPQALFRAGGLELVSSDTQEKAQFLKKLGINVNMAPVCDVSTDSGDYIYARTFGKDAAQTAEYVRTVVEVMDAEGMGSVSYTHLDVYKRQPYTHSHLAVAGWIKHFLLERPPPLPGFHRTGPVRFPRCRVCPPLS